MSIFGSTGSSSVSVETSTQHIKYDYGAREDSNPVYKGYNSSGVPTSAPTWIIHKYTYDASNRVIDDSVGIGSWDNRENMAYNDEPIEYIVFEGETIVFDGENITFT